MKKRILVSLIIFINASITIYGQGYKIENISIIDVLGGKEIPGQVVWIS